jgi:hypothetical protein
LEQFRDATNAVGQDGFTGLEPLLKQFLEGGEPGWDRWESKVFRSFTGAQRALVIWSMVARTSCNAAERAYAYFENRVDAKHCRDVFTAIDSFKWPDLSERFRRLFADCIGDPERPERSYKEWRRSERDGRKRMHAQVKKIVLKRSGQVFSDERTLDMFALRLADAGEITLPARNVDAADEFTAWLKLPETKTESVVRIRTWMWERQSELFVLRSN